MNVWPANSLALLDMLFLAQYNKPNKSNNHTGILFITCFCKKWNVIFILVQNRQTASAGPATVLLNGLIPEFPTILGSF